MHLRKFLLLTSEKLNTYESRAFGGQMVAKEVVDLLLQLSRGLLAESAEDKLTPAQWIALRYFSRANTFSRTLSGLATYQATTAGTTSQTIKSLEQSRLLERDRSAEDARSSVFTLTEAGWSMMEHDPLTHLAQEIESLSASELLHLREISRYLLANIGGQQTRHPFGTCNDCIFLLTRQKKGPDGGVITKHFLCKLLDLPIVDYQLDLLCKNFQPLLQPLSLPKR